MTNPFSIDPADYEGEICSQRSPDELVDAISKSIEKESAKLESAEQGLRLLMGGYQRLRDGTARLRGNFPDHGSVVFIEPNIRIPRTPEFAPLIATLIERERENFAWRDSNRKRAYPIQRIK